MAQKMVRNFRRSLSFPNPNPTPNTFTKHKNILHVRSTSLPCTRAHPIISQLHDQIADLHHSWSSDSRDSAWICLGLTRLRSVHESLDDLLLLPQTRDSLRKNGDYSVFLIEKLLEHFLRFVDVYGIFQTLILRVKEEVSSAQIALRRRDECRNKIESHFKNLSKIGKEIGKLVNNLISIGKSSKVLVNEQSYDDNDDEVELVEVLNDVVRVTVLVSASVFGGIFNSLGFRRTTTFRGMCVGRKMRNEIVEGGIREFREVDLRGDVKVLSKKMFELEGCIVNIESCGEKVFRSLINTRVSLLNVLTQ